jgi:hypothetical protein
MTDIEDKPDKSNEGNKDKDNLGEIIGAFVTLLVNTDDINGTSKTYFTLVISLLS